MIKITENISISETEIKIIFITSPGPGGQNVNKVATAVQLRFNVKYSPSLQEDLRQRLLLMLRSRLTNQGDLLIKASRHRTQERNKKDALDRFVSLIKRAAIPPKKRKKTKPTFGSIQRRIANKKTQGRKKVLRQKKSLESF